MPVAVFNSREQLERFCRAYLNARFKSILELLQNGPLPASVIASHTGQPVDLVQRFLSDLVKMDLVREVKVRNATVYVPNFLLLPQLGVEISEDLSKDLGEKLFTALYEFADSHSEMLEELFNNLEGSCTPGRIALAVYFEAFKKALEGLQASLAEEEEEVAKAFSKRRRSV
ncbi:MAG: hypothetical protein J7L98_02930 [Candidatus Verstraetearchaeota archaeon]|nr:hypothetical protein [Candidatus Verstraetearchaeota archaeon]